MAILGGCGSSAATRPEITDGCWNEADCPVELPKVIVEGRDITFGYVTVPAFHAEPERGTVRIAVALVHSTGKTPAPDPLIMGMGGPGGSGLDGILPLVLSKKGEALLAQRDVIVYEQRGVKYTDPHLACPEVTKVKQAHIGEEVPAEEELAAVAACRDRLVAEGVDLNAFNTVESAADIPFIIDVLGYKGQFNYYGVSYGTILGQYLMRDYGERLRSVILDGVAPVDLYVISEHATMADRMFRLLFESCAADPECSEDYPNLEALFLETADNLNENPAMFTIEDPDGNEYQVSLTGNHFVYGMVLLAYEPGAAVAYVPMFIKQIAEGNYTIPKILAEHHYFGEESLAPGMRDAIRCSVNWSNIDSETDDSNLYPQVVSAMGSDGGQAERCAIWNVAPLGEYVKEPVVSDIPTLLISGEYDPVTPRSYADRVAANFSHSYSYTFPGGAHGNFLNLECTDNITLAFLENPTQEPDASCIDDMTVKFGPPSIFAFVLAMAKANLSLVILGIIVLAAVIVGIKWLIRRRKVKQPA